MFGNRNNNSDVEREQSMILQQIDEQASRQQQALVAQDRQEELKTLARWSLDIDKLLEETRQQWCGEYEDNEGNIQHDETEALMTHEGATRLSNLLKQICHKVNFLNDYHEEEIKLRTYIYARKVNNWLRLNHSKYQIDVMDLSIISVPIVSLIYASLNKSKSGGDRLWVSRFHTVHESNIGGQAVKKKGLFSMFK